MWLKVERIDDVTLLVPSRSLLGEPDMERIEVALDLYIAAGQRKILLDLKNVQLLSSRALQGLLRLQLRAQRERLTMCLCNVDQIVQVTAQFWIRRLFTVRDSREAGLQEFASPSVRKNEATPPP